MVQGYYLHFHQTNSIKKVAPNKVLDLLYSGEASIPIKPSKNVTQTQIKAMREQLSKSVERIPLYDVYSRDIYLIKKKNLYRRVVKDSYRFPDQKFLDQLKELLKTLIKDPSAKLYRKKVEKNIKFLTNFDLQTLEQTYVSAFYYDSPEVGQEITTCQRKSFLPYVRGVTPYYRQSELVNLGLNMGKEGKDPEELCQTVNQNDINATILLEHQKYMEKNQLNHPKNHQMSQ